MKYIICEKPGQFCLKEKETPAYAGHEAIIKIKAIGICGTDLHAYAGNQAYFSYPRILGHELGAEVLEIGNEVTHIKLGDRVVVMPYLSCGHCIACRNGKTNCCTKMQVLGVHVDGGMQEQLAVPAQFLLPVNELSFQELVIVEPLAIGAHALRRAQVEAGETIVVMGCGPIGLGIMSLAKAKGVRVIAVDTVRQRLDFAKEKTGVDEAVNAAQDTVRAVAEMTNGDMATAVFDATGHRSALESGPGLMSHGGRFVLVGLSKGDLTFNHPAIHAKESTIICSRNANLEDFQTVITALKAGQFPTSAFVTHTVAFDEMIGHFDSWLDPENGVIKAMVIL